MADSCGPDVKPFCLQYAVDANLIATGEVVKWRIIWECIDCIYLVNQTVLIIMLKIKW